VTQAEAGVASREEDLIVAVGSLLTAEDSLRQLLNPGYDHTLWRSTLIPSDEPDFTLEDPDVRDAIEVAKKNRPELEQQRLTVQSNGMQEKIDRRAKRWDLVLEGRYNLEGLEGRGKNDLFSRVPAECFAPELYDPGDPVNSAMLAVCADRNGSSAGPGDPGIDFPFGSAPVKIGEQVFLDTGIEDAIKGLNETEFADWTLQATLTIPIHNRAAKSRYVTSRLRREQSQVRLDQLMLAVEIDVRQKVRDVRVNTQRVHAAQKNRELQEKNVDAEEKKYENGMSTSFQVLQIQEDLSTAESRESRAKVDFQKSLAALERAKGTLLQARNIEISSLQDLSGQEFAGGYGLSGSGR
jgi:outer membrane protein